MDTILNTVEEVLAAYTTNNVNPKRVLSMNDKFVTLPDEFTCDKLMFVDLTIGKKTLTNIPAMGIGNGKYVLIGQFMSSYTDKKTASKITKAGANFDKFLVVNNKKLNECAEGVSEAELVLFLQGKKFKAEKAKDFPVYASIFNEDGSVSFHTTEVEALAAVKPKSYRKLNVVA